MLHLGNVQPGGRYIAVDDASGILVSAILDRLNGQSVISYDHCFLIPGLGNGRLLSIGDIEGAPAYPVITQMNFPPEILNVHATLNWATADESYTPSTPTPSRCYRSFTSLRQSYFKPSLREKE
jgi:tRNA (adenine58-N1)-methyltransferase non-catalytic subunit